MNTKEKLNHDKIDVQLLKGWKKKLKKKTKIIQVMSYYRLNFDKISLVFDFN
jgi:hypothetical protein